MDKAQLIEKYRYFNVECGAWWDSTYDQFGERMLEQGILVTDIHFSGFYTQGDGACFEGFIKDTKKFLEVNFKPDEYPMIRNLLEHGGDVKFRCQHSGHYYHENSTAFDIDNDLFAYVLPTTTDFHEQIVAAWDEALNHEMEEFTKDSKEIFRRHMRELYRELEQDYDYLTSDEAVWEAIESNELNQGEEDGDSKIQ
jgi:hypothetical protein